MGRLDDYQQHKVRVWSNYSGAMGRFGSLDVTPMWRYNSALTYSLAAANGVTLSAVQRSRNPGYARLPGSGANGSQTLFFAERGSEEFAGYGLVDLGVDVSGAGLAVAQAVAQVGSAERTRQRQADWLGHDDRR